MYKTVTRNINSTNTICPVCDNNKINKKIYSYYKCKNCSSLYLTKTPLDKDLNRATQKFGKNVLKEKADKKYVDYINKRVLFLSKHLKPKNRILDIGCGNGLFLEQAAKQNFKVYAMEGSSSIVKKMRERGFKTYENFEKIPSHYFDTITFFDVIEHTDNPRQFIKIIKKKLKKDGIIMLTTPNCEGITAKVRPHVLTKAKNSQGNHPVLFNISSLKKMLKEEGFKVLSAKTDILMPWNYSKNILFRKVMNKIVYLSLSPLAEALYKEKYGDNIQILAKVK